MDGPFSGTELELIVIEPKEISTSDTDAIVALLELGGAVAIRGLRDRLEKSRLVALVKSDDEVVSVGALKNPEQTYLESVACKSGASIPADALELGYIATSKRFRRKGLAARTSRALVAHHDGPSFATTSSSAIEQILTSLKFDRAGADSQSGLHPNETLVLLLRDATSRRC